MIAGVPEGTATITGNSRIVAMAISVPRREKSRVAANTPTKVDLDIENSAPKFTTSASHADLVWPSYLLECEN